MNKSEHGPKQFESLSEAMKILGFPAPQHPLIALVNGVDKPLTEQPPHHRHVLSFYKISFRPHLGGTLRYGQTYFDFSEGGMFFAAPHQIVGNNDQVGDGHLENQCVNQQITLLIHPDFLLNYPLAKTIKRYHYFSYSINEALHLSDKEKEVVLSVFRNMEDELNSRIDDISHDVIISQVELLLNYAHRFYKRQFITRKPVNDTVLQNLEAILDEYFDGQTSLNRGIPTVQSLADRLNFSPSYLSDMLRSLTGQNTQQHIHNKLIEKAKEKLSTTGLSVSEIAYSLGFEHPQSFSKFFRNKINQSPIEFRERFN
ncbi:helix-turn-helix domain-containing protein [Parapedobacter sp. DT-150]|uniref:helix-turn-helix domain-containing protein n=1 Tax=Parapedobacter sp. DT-150 TaxID=3396162 RepID=UPI003F1C6A24